MMVCGRFYSLRVESPSGYDILSISGFLPSPPHAAHGMRGGGQITRRKPVASATSLSTACTITSWGCGLTSAIPPPLLQHAAGLTRVVLDDCSALPDWGLRGAVTDGHGAGWQATALRPQEKRRTGIPVLGLS